MIGFFSFTEFSEVANGSLMYQTTSELDCKLFVSLELDLERHFLLQSCWILNRVHIIILESYPKIWGKIYGKAMKVGSTYSFCLLCTLIENCLKLMRYFLNLKSQYLITEKKKSLFKKTMAFKKNYRHT